MNIVLCDKNCQYQKDGYCNINRSYYVSNLSNNECPYFTNKNNLNNKFDSKISIFDSIKKADEEDS